jgi:phage shock protein PspC (stress-responsive transcriptional regulator)
MEPIIKRFYRSRTDRIVFGVCGGLARYFEIDVTLVRVIFVLLALSGSLGILLYIILAIITPLEPGQKLTADTAANLKHFVDEVKAGANSIAAEMRGSANTTRNILGLLIVAIGLALLMQNLFHVIIRWTLFTPILIVIFGLYLILKHK